MAKGFAALNPSSNNSFTIPSGQGQIVEARVTDIILDETHPDWGKTGQWNGIGTIKFELIEQVKQPKSNATAIPLYPQFKNYPLINETVLIFQFPNRNLDKFANIKGYYYLNPINLWNHPHHNAFPDVYKENTSEGQNSDYESIGQGKVRRVKDGSTDIELNSPSAGGTFIERSNIHPILPFAGDNIFEGRFGNSLRLGNTAKTKSKITNNWSMNGENGNPIIIIRNGQDPGANTKGWVPITENINKDLSSIYLTSNQTIPLTNSIENYKAFSSKPTLQREYNQNQIILNSGRLVFNSNVDDIILTSQKRVSLSSGEDVGISSKKRFVVDSNSIKLGSRFANEPIILGGKFMFQFEQLLISLKNLTEALEGLQAYPGGMATPEPVIPPIATTTKNVIEEIMNLVTDEKTPLLSRKSKVE